MRLAIGSDHAGFEMKEKLIPWLRSPEGGNHKIVDLGPASPDRCDYPDFAAKVGRAVAQKRAAKGILLCGTGIGMAIAANKIRGIRAGVVWNDKSAGLAAEHNEVNVVCLPARMIGIKKAQSMLHVFLNTRFGGGRHARRIKKITQLDQCA